MFTNAGCTFYQFFTGFTMNFSRFLAPLSTVALAITALVVVSCGTTPGTGPIGGNVTVPNAVDSLQATSVNASTVRLRWAAPSTTGLSGYRVTVLTGTTVFGTINPTSTIVDVTGLTAGTVYTFRVQSRTSDTASAAREVMWSPAVRLTNMQGAVIRVYETASSFGSGLRFQGGTALNLTVARGNEWDIGIDTRANDGNVRIGSPAQLGYSFTGARNTPLADNVYSNVDSLNQVFDTQLRIGTPGVFTVTPTTRRGFVFGARTIEGNHAKVFVKANTSGVILQGVAPDRYIEVEISYQPTANVPYASAPVSFTGERIQSVDGIEFRQNSNK
jgi:hypothetical protein